jgi:hypothetical protein
MRACLVRAETTLQSVLRQRKPAGSGATRPRATPVSIELARPLSWGAPVCLSVTGLPSLERSRSVSLTGWVHPPEGQALAAGTRATNGRACLVSRNRAATILGSYSLCPQPFTVGL